MTGVTTCDSHICVSGPVRGQCASMFPGHASWACLYAVLQADMDAAVSELKAVQLVERQLLQFQAEMERDAAAQREALNKVCVVGVGRVAQREALNKVWGEVGERGRGGEGGGRTEGYGL